MPFIEYNRIDGKVAWDHFKIMEFELADEKAVQGFHSATSDEEKSLPIKLKEMCLLRAVSWMM